jgi:hypothetical protein
MCSESSAFPPSAGTATARIDQLRLGSDSAISQSLDLELHPFLCAFAIAITASRRRNDRRFLVATILCFAGRNPLSKTIAGAARGLGHVVISSNRRRVLRDLADRRAGAVIIDWESIRGKKPGVIRAIKSVGVPVVVVTSRLNCAFLAGEPSADVYLEKPCSVQELLACVSELIRAEQKCRSAPQGCSSANAAGRT